MQRHNPTLRRVGTVGTTSTGHQRFRLESWLTFGSLHLLLDLYRLLLELQKGLPDHYSAGQLICGARNGPRNARRRHAWRCILHETRGCGAAVQAQIGGLLEAQRQKHEASDFLPFLAQNNTLIRNQLLAAPAFVNSQGEVKSLLKELQIFGQVKLPIRVLALKLLPSRHAQLFPC